MTQGFSINIERRTDLNVSVPFSLFAPFNTVPGLAQAFSRKFLCDVRPHVQQAPLYKGPAVTTLPTRRNAAWNHSFDKTHPHSSWI